MNAIEVDSVSITYASSSARHRIWGRTPAAGFQAVRDVSFTVAHGEIVGLVGESGSGKTSVARCVAGYQQPTTGVVRIDGTELSFPSARSARRRVQMIFQDPYSSLNPSMTVRHAVREPISVHGLRPKGEIDKRVDELAELVGLEPHLMNSRPRRLSGGQRQRASIARALALEPDVLVADEPVSALDVSVQAVVLNLLATLREELGTSILFISHDIAVVSHLCDQVVVMTDGTVVESGPTVDVFTAPVDPYTRELIAAVPPHPWAEHQPAGPPGRND
ncbi:MAG: hypothetical protein JWO46_972 [Nocardioidaceae bacterium]|nr:hypothetical protein [Nocardioidaceae bacterium]